MGSALDYSKFEEGRGVNYWKLDRAIRRELRRIYTDEEFEWAEPRLTAFGEVVGHTIADNADYVDDHGPELESYDKHGEVQNRVRYPAELLETERLAYEHGIVADAFETPPDRDEPMPLSHNLAMQYLLSYADPGFDCPVAMTAGAALVLEKFDDGSLAAYYEALTSRDYEGLIEGAMFLTEKQGGSDVGAAETLAEYDDEADCWRLTGEKWFCSNIDAEGTLALARTPDAPEGTDGLSMFLVPHADPDRSDGPWTKGDRLEDGPLSPGEVNDQRYRRLKDKLGTISVPTGAVEFGGAKASLVGEEERGFEQMTEMLNLERLSNAAASCGIIARALLESKIHAANREAFGETIDQYPLMREDLVDMTVDHEAATAYVFEVARLFSERERAERAGDTADDTYRLMRLLIPIAKLRTARMAVDTASYAMEVQGGNGYVNDFVTNRLLRDAQVLPIWEGTENILSLDVLRALEREDAHEPFRAAVEERLESVSHPALEDAAETVEAEFRDLETALVTLAGEDAEYAQLSAKRLSHYVFDVFTAALLLEEAQIEIEDGDGRLALVANRFVTNELEKREARGMTGGDRFVLEAFDAVVHHEPTDYESLLDRQEEV
ncbi:acyl-CoA dehydrogenase family protein [Natronobacterium gregoryi]|uniref:Acyl-CoA dehydrogenase n=2 Tax=Natronobacterium gregoryi TaxID=44930 RepID=L0AGC2_NATGS|nr:acyl-CoA dehydrogenase family protein [Natronobacterium gregoryi]AFZ72968.1 acyl-CoA dehydrogenase [Natronobacterium gregoryi SP2]ELY69884.1 acyl-CoA dehydrogenase domain-containing protein [Natronobacterium gregoryi SP2]PLK21809.1 acyl-CoA dehydrogenase [Natronobacterium gregoryi SP2]SFI68747.1 Acyl-CoA dehydrogenase [Natronobacterium gregoryi]